MARKLKFTPKTNQQPGLFDLTGDLFETPSAVAPTTPAAPLSEEAVPATDFDITIPADFARRHRPEKESVEVDPSTLNLKPSIVFLSFGSGSSGNSAYIGDADGGILIDAGVDTDKIRDGLRANGLNFDSIKGICLTHDHSDHVRYVYSLVRKHPHIGVYCTPKTLSGIMRRHSISRRLKDYHRPIYKEFPFTIGNFRITAFEVSHDGTDNSGFFVSHGDQNFAIATDLGCITPRVEFYMSQADHIMIESNYDAEMMRNGSYPMHLKARITADNGHLDNRVTAEFLNRIAGPRLTHIFLCHLSQDNNTPQLAVETVRHALEKAGLGPAGGGSGSIAARACALQLSALPRYEASQLFTLRRH